MGVHKPKNVWVDPKMGFKEDFWLQPKNLRVNLFQNDKVKEKTKVYLLTGICTNLVRKAANWR